MNKYQRISKLLLLIVFIGLIIQSINGVKISWLGLVGYVIVIITAVGFKLYDKKQKKETVNAAEQ